LVEVSLNILLDKASYGAHDSKSIVE
jgi:hypothetical protein